jgi:hypothetical protein
LTLVSWCSLQPPFHLAQSNQRLGFFTPCRPGPCRGEANGCAKSRERGPAQPIEGAPRLSRLPRSLLLLTLTPPPMRGPGKGLNPRPGYSPPLPLPHERYRRRRWGRGAKGHGAGRDPPPPSPPAAASSFPSTHAGPALLFSLIGPPQARPPPHSRPSPLTGLRTWMCGVCRKGAQAERALAGGVPRQRAGGGGGTKSAHRKKKEKKVSTVFLSPPRQTHTPPPGGAMDVSQH